MIHDLRYGLRWFRANPGFTVAALLVLSLGIGATTATFCVVHSVALRPLRLHQPDGLVRIWSNQPRANIAFLSVSRADFEDWRAQSRAFSQLGAYDAQRAMVLKSGAEHEVVLGSHVSGDLFALLGVPPLRGRWIGPEEARPGGAAVAVISYGLWQRRFGGRDVLGQTLVVDDAPSTIAGVMPPQFSIPNNPAELWLPLQSAVDPSARASRSLRVLGRLRPGIGVDEARSELTQVAASLGLRYPASNRDWGVTMRPIEETVVSPELRRALLMLIGAVVVVLIVACANVAGLLLSRATTRRREMAVRTALGAPRRVLVRQMLVEGVLLASASGLAGLVIAMWIVDGLAQIAASTIPRADEIAFRPAVAAVAVAATAMTAIFFALVPALEISRFTLDSLRSRESGGQPGASRSRDLLVVAETALAVVLLVGAGLLVRSFVRLQDRSLGFDPERLVVMQLAAPDSAAAAARREAAHDTLLTAIAAVPGVERASGVVNAPFSGRNPGDVFAIVGRPPRAGEPPPNADYRVVTPGYLRTMRIQVVRGRDLREGDGPQSPAVVISEAMARRYWPDVDPIGTQIDFGHRAIEPGHRLLTIVGIAADVRYAALDAPTDALRPMIYLPHRLMPEVPLEIVVRTRTSTESLVPAIRAAAASAAPAMPVARLDLMTDTLADERGAHRFYTTVLAAFAWIALCLAAAGLWALIAYGVARRTHEIGVRVALGARPGDVLWIAAGRGLALAAAGLSIGLAGAAAAARVLDRLLIGIEPTDAATFAAIAVAFLAVATAASVLPARRALRIDPAQALRLE